MNSRELCNYIERFRSARKLSQENMTDGIVSLRQYRRYLNGESDMPFSIFNQIIDKLGLHTDNVLREMENARFEEYEYANKLYNLAVNYNFREFDKVAKERRFTDFIDTSNKILYEFAFIMKDYYHKQIDRKQTYQKAATLINYPQILKHEMVTEIELLVISFLIDVSGKVDQKKIIYFMNEYVKVKSNLISLSNPRMVILILARFAKFFGIREEYEEVIEYCDLALERTKKYMSYYLAEYLHYYKSLAYYKLGRSEDFEDALVKCFNVLEYEGNQSKIKKFETLINEDYDIEFKSYVVKHYNEILNIKGEPKI